ncbi:hypothetical protein AGMMS49546_34810 [Spirochaetia bacterium]|nr:hypothetical protein AGMMS49546_34810 [Spirochaetia bacterium]
MTPEDQIINNPDNSFPKHVKAVVDKAGKAYSWELLESQDKTHQATGNLIVQAMKIADPAAREQVIADIRALRKAYVGTPAEYKATNGKVSNLGHEQWYAVRTPSFKEWFGEWERVERIASIKGIEPKEYEPKNISKRDAKTIFQYF